jgi:hypothetical protein
MSFIPMSITPADPVPAEDACPHCKAPLNIHRFSSGGVVLATYHCPRHGDVVPMRSAIINRYHHLEPVT